MNVFLATDRVYLPPLVTKRCCELLPHSFHPYPAHFSKNGRGGFVSVALSLELPLVAVSNCHFPMLPGLSSYISAGS